MCRAKEFFTIKELIVKNEDQKQKINAFKIEIQQMLRQLTCNR